MEQRCSILLIDGDEQEFHAQRQPLAQVGLELRWSGDLKGAYELLRQHPADAVLLDLNLGQTSGVETVRAFRAVHQDVPLVVFTSQDDFAVTRDSLRADAQDFLVKGEQPWRIARSVENAIERHFYQSTLRDAFGSSEDGIAITTPDGEVLFANRAAISLLPEPVPGEGWVGGVQVLPDGRRLELRVSEIRWNGLPALLVSARSDSPTVRLLRDHDGLMQIQRMEVLGRMASGVASNLDKLLSNLVEQASGLAPTNEAVAQILPLARSAALMNRQLVRLASGPAFREEAVELSQLADQTLYLLKPVLGAKILLKTSFSEQALVVAADRAHLQHVMVNLIANAREALPDGGILRVLTERSEGRGVIRVEDSGPGIAPELMNRVFEPFFTTRSGQLGMGLTTALGLVSEMGGSLTLESSRLGGLKVVLSFPLLTDGEVSPDSVREMQGPVLKGTVLLIDDEPLVLASLEKSLSKLGLSVQGFSSGEQALEEFRQNPEVFDFAILDLRMPGMDGEACLKELRALRPELKAIVSSGFYNSGVETLQNVEILYKPHTFEELVNTVQRILT